MNRQTIIPNSMLLQNSQNIEAILSRLAPVQEIKAVERSSAPLPVIINDTTDEAMDDPMYINRYNSNGELPDIDDLKSGVLFKLGIQTIESHNISNVNNLAWWNASSSKQGNPVENVLNDDPNSFWQSDGAQPHLIDVYFSRMMSIALIALYFSISSDESYTPKVFKLYVGTSPSDAVFYKSYHIDHLDGWVGLTFSDNREDALMKCQFIRFVFPINHENGKDTHLRGVRLYSPASNNAGKQTTAPMPVTRNIFQNRSFTIR